MKKQLPYIKCLLAILVFVTALNAYPVPQERGAVENNLYDARLILAARDELELTKEQEEKIETLMLQYEAAAIQQSAEIKIQELHFASYLKSQPNEIDRKQVEKYIREISRQKTTMIILYMNYLLDAKQTLTPSQLQSLTRHRKRLTPPWGLPRGKR